MYKLERVNCNICNTDETRLFCLSKSKYSDDIFSIVKCRNCGLVYVNPRIEQSDSYNSYVLDKNTIPYYKNLWLSRFTEGRNILRYVFCKYKIRKVLFAFCWWEVF